MKQIKVKWLPPLAVLLCAAAFPAWSAVDPVYVDVTVAPPAPQVEPQPAVREGYVWAPGYWDMRANRYVWVGGHWERERKGFRYVAPRWVENQGRWTLYAENWVKDEDAKDKTGIDAREKS